MIRPISVVLLVCLLLCGIRAVIVEKKSTRSIALMIGSVYRTKIPVVFHNFQHSELREFKDVATNKSSFVCGVRSAEQGVLTQRSSIHYESEVMHNVSREWMEDRIIHKFSELIGLRVFVDAISFRSKLYAFFSSNQIITYDLDLSDGTLEVNNKVSVNSTIKIGNGRFVVVAGHLLLISQTVALKIQENGGYSQITGYGGTEGQITSIKALNGSLYIGLGVKGMASYAYDIQKMSLTFLKRYTFAFRDVSIQQFFDVDQFQIDGILGIIYILDYSEGLLEVSLSELKSLTEIYSASARLLMSRCENLVLLSLSIFVTCPELVQIDRQSKQIMRVVHNTFYPYFMEHVNLRLYLYGRQSFAVYDLFGKAIDEYKLSLHAEYSLVIGSYIVTFSNFGVASEEILAQPEELYCFSKNANQIGDYVGTLQTQGICKQYLGQNTQAIPKDGYSICSIQQSIKLSLRDFDGLDLRIQFYLFLIWLGASLVIGLVLGIRLALTRRKYQVLVEQQPKSTEMISKAVSQNECKQEQVVAED